jgi:hypothetical protein
MRKGSKKNGCLTYFPLPGKNNHSNKYYQFWQQNYHPVELNSNSKLEQRIVYLHENPVRSGLVWEAWHYKYSSAMDYYTNEKGVLPIEHIADGRYGH